MKNFFLMSIPLILVAIPPSVLPQSKGFFPPNILGSNSAEDQFTAKRYAGYLQAMGEPSLWAMSGNRHSQVYRFLWLRTFHHPIAVRVTIDASNSGIVVTKVLDGQGGYKPGKLLSQAERKVGAQEVQGFLSVLDRQKFWTMPTLEPSSHGGGNDGARWITEGAKDGQYHVTDRWSPQSADAQSIGIEFLVNLAKLKLGGDELY